MSIHIPILAVISASRKLHILRLHTPLRNPYLRYHFCSAEIFRYINCPTLRKLDVDFPDSDIQAELPRFLRRHPRLGTLESARTQIYHPIENLQASILMPNLTRFDAAPGHFECLDERTPLEHAFTFRITLTYSLDQDLPALKLFTRLKSFCITTAIISHAAIKSIAWHLPQLEILEVRHSDYVARLPTALVSILYNLVLQSDVYLIEYHSFLRGSFSLRTVSSKLLRASNV